MLSTEQLIELCARGGETALGLVGRVAREYKHDRSVVTQADREVEQQIREEALRLAPGLGLLGEEMAIVPPDGEWTLVIDPIDGTSSYVDGLPTWAVTVALCRNMKPVRGVVLLPAIDEWYAAGDDTDGLIASVSIEPRTESAEVVIDRTTRVLVHSRAHRYVLPGFPGKFRSLGSLAYHLALVARGSALGAFLGHARFWDWAAGAVLLDAIGGEVIDLDGNTADPEAHFCMEPASLPLLAGVRPGLDALRECFADPDAD